MLPGVPLLDLEQVPASIYVTRSHCEPRTVCLTKCCPCNMQRAATWRVEDFQLHKQLYKGKASLLYSATCRLSGTPVALKLYRKNKLSNLNWYQVEREIRIHSQLRHPNIIQLFAAFEDAENIYMAQEFAAGGDLYEELKARGGRLPEARVAADIIRPCMRALVYLHDQSIIHRDVKSENILLAGDGTVKLADFGLSICHAQERPVTRAGTLDMMAPEVLMCPEKSRPEENKEKAILEYTAAVDAWAVGIVAFELLVGHPPFERESRSETYEHIMYRAPVMPAGMGPAARGFVQAALVKAVSKRPSVEQLLRHPWLAEHRGLLCAGPAAAEAEQAQAQKPAKAAKRAGSANPFRIMIDCTSGTEERQQSSGSSSSSSSCMDAPEPARAPAQEEQRPSVMAWAGSSLKTITKKLRKPVSSASHAGAAPALPPSSSSYSTGGASAGAQAGVGEQPARAASLAALERALQAAEVTAAGRAAGPAQPASDALLGAGMLAMQQRLQALQPLPREQAAGPAQLPALALPQGRRSLHITTTGLEAHPPSPPAHVARPWMQRLPPIRTELAPPSPKQQQQQQQQQGTPSPLARRRRRLAGTNAGMTDASCSGSLTLADTPKGGHFPSGAQSARMFGRLPRQPSSPFQTGSGRGARGSPKAPLQQGPRGSPAAGAQGSMTARHEKGSATPPARRLLSARKLSFEPTAQQQQQPAYRAQSSPLDT